MLRAALSNVFTQRQALVKIARVLRERGGNVTHAARDLGVSIRTMRRVMAEHASLRAAAERARR